MLVIALILHRRPIQLTTTTTTTTASPSTTILFTTTPLPVLLSSTYHTPIQSKLSNNDNEQSSAPSHISLKALQDIASVTTVTENHIHHDKIEEPQAVPVPTHNDINDDAKLSHDQPQHEEEHTDQQTEQHLDSTDESINENSEQHTDDDNVSEHLDEEIIEETTSVEQRLKKISDEITKYSSSESEPDANRPSFFSLSDLIKTLRPSEKVAPQIDSDYSNTMRVLGERSVVYNSDDVPKSKNGIDLKQANRALY